MDSKSNVTQLLEQIDAPALIVKQGAIIAVNQTAKSHFISPDASIEDALGPYYQDYCQLKSGSLFLTVHFCETDYPCAIHTMDDQHLFVLEEPMQDTLSPANEPSFIMKMWDRLLGKVKNSRDIS